MNLQQLFNLKASLIASRVRLADAIHEVQQAIDAALAPDAGMVVVKADAHYGMWDSRNVYVSVYKTYFASWDYSWIVNTGWAHAALVWRADGDTTSPNPRTAVVPSHLTIADGRGEGEVTTQQYGGFIVWRGLYGGHNPWLLSIGMFDHLLVARLPWAINKDYIVDDSSPLLQWWPRNTPPTIDCGAVPHAMTWRAA